MIRIKTEGESIIGGFALCGKFMPDNYFVCLKIQSRTELIL